ncbi:hypothetical protein SSP35_18_00410 [Streptomyces sp. NBRC 110611]|nr:hypothetical protein SSP35_18_00410 [Streptomyces sp. NBRC 110611]
MLQRMRGVARRSWRSRRSARTRAEAEVSAALAPVAEPRTGPGVRIISPLALACVDGVRTVTDAPRAAAALTAWRDPRLSGEQALVVDPEPPLVFRTAIGLWSATGYPLHRRAAPLVWAVDREREPEPESDGSGGSGSDGDGGGGLVDAVGRPGPARVARMEGVEDAKDVKGAKGVVVVERKEGVGEDEGRGAGRSGRSPRRERQWRDRWWRHGGERARAGRQAVGPGGPGRDTGGAEGGQAEERVADRVPLVQFAQGAGAKRGRSGANAVVAGLARVETKSNHPAGMTSSGMPSPAVRGDDLATECEASKPKRRRKARHEGPEGREELDQLTARPGPRGARGRSPDGYVPVVASRSASRERAEEAERAEGAERPTQVGGAARTQQAQQVQEAVSRRNSSMTAPSLPDADSGRGTAQGIGGPQGVGRAKGVGTVTSAAAHTSVHVNAISDRAAVTARVGRHLRSVPSPLPVHPPHPVPSPFPVHPPLPVPRAHSAPRPHPHPAPATPAGTAASRRRAVTAVASTAPTIDPEAEGGQGTGEGHEGADAAQSVVPMSGARSRMTAGLPVGDKPQASMGSWGIPGSGSGGGSGRGGAAASRTPPGRPRSRTLRGEG